jgi:tRNA modification GTPase
LSIAVFSTSDTIVALATPPGRSGVGVVRLSGADAFRVASLLVGRSRPFEPRRATLARFAFARGITPGSDAPPVADQVVVTAFPGPHSYTGEDVVEVSAHGSPVVLEALLASAVASGARLAEAGEFTLRAFLNGKLDLVQAEAVADLIEAVTPLQARVAFDQLEGTLTTEIRAIEGDLFDLVARLEASLDFPDEGYHFVEIGRASEELVVVIARIAALLAATSRGRLIREGAQVAIVGTPNVGKSSLFNALLNAPRAIVTAIPGTTRDLVTERANVGGFAIALVDTAGVRESADVVEREGIARAREAGSVADLLLLVLDRSRPLSDDDRRLVEDTAARARVVVANKADAAAAWSTAPVDEKDIVEVSALTGAGMTDLVARIVATLSRGVDVPRDAPMVTNVRHVALLQTAHAAVGRAVEALAGAAVSEEFVLADLQDAMARLQEITGQRTTDDLLRHIFERFCIGK